jgi:hypothetical protein
MMDLLFWGGGKVCNSSDHEKGLLYQIKMPSQHGMFLWETKPNTDTIYGGVVYKNTIRPTYAGSSVLRRMKYLQ